MRMVGWNVLERHFDGLSADEVDAELTAIPSLGTTPVSESARGYLVEHGGPDLGGETGTPNDIHRRRALTAARTLSETVRSALTIDQASKALGISKSRVSHRLADGTLWAFTVQGRRYLPRWQFTSDGRTVPGLPVITAAIPTNLHPLALDSFMTTPRPDFDRRSPFEWLISGGDPRVIADWLTAMGRE